MTGGQNTSDAFLQKTKMCRFYGMGACSRGEACSFAHSRSDLKKQPNLQKTQLCLAFERNGVCRDGAACKYAHGMKELRGSSAKKVLDVQSPHAYPAAFTLPAPPGLGPLTASMPQYDKSQIIANGMTSVDSSPIGINLSDALPSPACLTTGKMSRQMSPKVLAVNQFLKDSNTWGKNGIAAGMYPDSGYPTSFQSTECSLASDDASTGDDSSADSNQLAKVPEATFRKTKMCKFFVQGKCNRGDACGFAHELNTLREQPDLYRTNLCLSFARNGTCKEGVSCRYAHGVEQLRTCYDQDGKKIVLEMSGGESELPATYDQDGSSASQQDPLFVTFAFGRVCLSS